MVMVIWRRRRAYREGVGQRGGWAPSLRLNAPRDGAESQILKLSTQLEILRPASSLGGSGVAARRARRRRALRGALCRSGDERDRRPSDVPIPVNLHYPTNRRRDRKTRSRVDTTHRSVADSIATGANKSPNARNKSQGRPGYTQSAADQAATDQDTGPENGTFSVPSQRRSKANPVPVAARHRRRRRSLDGARRRASGTFLDDGRQNLPGAREHEKISWLPTGSDVIKTKQIATDENGNPIMDGDTPQTITVEAMVTQGPARADLLRAPRRLVPAHGGRPPAPARGDRA